MSDPIRDALAELVRVIDARHYGRMPDEVAQAMAAARAALAQPAEPVAEMNTHTLPEQVLIDNSQGRYWGYTSEQMQAVLSAQAARHEAEVERLKSELWRAMCAARTGAAK